MKKCNSEKCKPDCYFCVHSRRCKEEDKVIGCYAGTDEEHQTRAITNNPCDDFCCYETIGEPEENA